MIQNNIIDKPDRYFILTLLIDVFYKKWGFVANPKSVQKRKSRVA